MARWKYNGDMNLTEGGYFWREDDQFGDYADIVDVVPDSNMGGADNVFHVYVGSVYIPEESDKRKAALDCCGYTDDPAKAPFDVLVDAFMCYHGIDTAERHTIRIGGIDPYTQDASVPEIDLFQIRGNWKLSNYIKKHFLD